MSLDKLVSHPVISHWDINLSDSYHWRNERLNTGISSAIILLKYILQRYVEMLHILKLFAKYISVVADNDGNNSALLFGLFLLMT